MVINLDQPFIFHSVDKCTFGFYSDNEIRKLSSCKIIHDITHTSTQIPEDGGLYDSKMGSLRGYICKNCGLNDLQCPGHVGHIELSYPVFNPMFFHICERLMNIKCFNCHHLRISSKNKKIFLKQIRLTMKGDIYQFFSTNDRIINRNNMDNHLSKRKKNIYQKKDYSTNSEKLMIRANLFKNLFKQKFHNICPYCYLGNPKFKNENYLELIQEKCSKKIQTYNTLNNIKLKDLLTGNIIYDIQHAIFPFSVENHLKALWSCEENLLTILFNNTDTTWKLFFKETILVSGNRFRPPIIIHHIGIIEHQQNKILKQILKANNILRKTINDLRKSRSTPIQMFLKKSLKNIYIQLQYSVNLYIDSSKSGKKNEFGIRQLLEKKEGLFRMNMMGKRVNYTARTVINPDPSLKTCEVGVPLFIALELTYDEPVNSYNYEKLKYYLN